MESDPSEVWVTGWSSPAPAPAPSRQLSHLAVCLFGHQPPRRAGGLLSQTADNRYLYMASYAYDTNKHLLNNITENWIFQSLKPKPSIEWWNWNSKPKLKALNFFLKCLAQMWLLFLGSMYSSLMAPMSASDLVSRGGRESVKRLGLCQAWEIVKKSLFCSIVVSLWYFFYIFQNMERKKRQTCCSVKNIKKI